MAPGSHPPAWYPDPGNPTRVRRWDGRSWTSDVRPIPDWLRTLHLSPGPPSPLPGTPRRLWLASAGLLSMAAVLMLVLSQEGRGAPRLVEDQQFLQAANSRCAEAERTVIGPHRGRAAGKDEAARVEAMADGWDDMITDIRTLEVRAADAGDVEAWLASWERWVSLRHRYAREVGDGDVRGAKLVEQAAQESRRSITSFASANGLPDCIFR